ncbi:unnamed protein product [Ilex paraguariensis]|uniref:Glycosyltransferase n=1 Tax=Ilex paraguariensis TaxID=185542 RepID=A0ABC8QS54_9AQUA
MKDMLRSRGERDELDNRSMGAGVRDSSHGLLRVMIVLITFVAGVVIGLTSSSHIQSYFTFQSDQFYKNYALAPMGSIGNNCSVVLHCEKEDCLSMKSFMRPKNLTHSMSDDELFWRASLVPKKAEYPFERVPKVAFMFLTRGPLPMLPLWERFFQRQDEKLYSIYVHALPGFKLDVTNTSVFYRRQIPSLV